MFLTILGLIIAAFSGPVLAPFGRRQVPDLEAERREASDRTPDWRAAGIAILVIGLGLIVAGATIDPGTDECTADGRCTNFQGTPLHLTRNDPDIKQPLP